MRLIWEKFKLSTILSLFFPIPLATPFSFSSSNDGTKRSVPHLLILIKNHRPNWASYVSNTWSWLHRSSSLPLGKSSHFPHSHSWHPHRISPVRSPLQSADQCVVTAQWTRLTTRSQLKSGLNNKPALTACYPPQWPLSLAIQWPKLIS